MLISVQVAALFVAISALLLAASVNWSEPTKLTEEAGYLSARIAAGPNGAAIVIWPEAAGVVVRMLTPGSDWGSITVISDGSGTIQSSPAIAMSGDGAAIAAWRQVIVDGPSFQSQIVARKFVPGAGWGPLQGLSTLGTDPSVAMAPDGRAHILFHQDASWLAKTLAPGENLWSSTTVLGEATGDLALVAGNGFAYAAMSGYLGTLKLATYTPDGWQPAVALPGSLDFRLAYDQFAPQLVANGGHVVLSWVQSGSGSDVIQWVQRLTGAPARFTVPRIGRSYFPGYSEGRVPCRIALLSDGAVSAICPVRGDPVLNCFDPTRSGPGYDQQAFYYYLEMYRRPLEGDWLSPETVSDVQRRVLFGSPRALANAQGDTLAVWHSELPCQYPSSEFSVRLWRSSTASWEPVTRPGSKNWSFDDLTVDSRGTFRLLWTDLDIDYARTPQAFSTLLTAELATHPQQSADVNGDGLVDCADLSLVRASFGKKAGEPGFDARADTNEDGAVDVKDFAFVAQQLPRGTQCQ